MTETVAATFERALGEILARVSISAPQPLAVAYSGGLDSAVLLHLASARADALGLRLHAFHVHHGLSPNADRWLAHAQAESAALQVEFQARRIQVVAGGSGIEQAARTGRYRALGDMCKEHGVRLLLTAHHLDDQAETVLLQLLRGAGIAGLSGMDVLNAAPGLLGSPDIHVARPLLAAGRSALEEYALAKRIRCVEDESNQDLHYARNALRHAAMPALARHFPGYQVRLARAAQHAQSAQRLLDEIAAQDFAACAEDGGIVLDRLAGLSPDRGSNLLRHWFAVHALRMPSTSWLEQLREQLFTAREDARVRVIHADCEIHRHRGRAILVPRLNEAVLQAPPQHFRWQGESMLHFPVFGGRLHFSVPEQGRAREWLAAQDLQISHRNGGETLKAAPNRPSRTLKQHYQALGIPAWERLQLPLVLTADGLLYAAGIGMNFTLMPAGLELALRWERDTA